jgi:hypothetical protein
LVVTKAERDAAKDRLKDAKAQRVILLVDSLPVDGAIWNIIATWLKTCSEVASASY